MNLQIRRPARLGFAIARALILAQTLAMIGYTLWELPAAYQNLHSFTPNLGFDGWQPAQLQAAAQASGLSTTLLADLLFGTSLVCLLSFWVVAALLAWRKRDSWIGLLIIYILVSTAPGFSLLASRVSDLAGPLTLYWELSVALTWPTFFILLYLFPDGQVVPRWTRFLLPIPYLAFLLAIRLDKDSGILVVMQVLILLFAAGGIASQVYRYQKISTSTQRQQTQWVILALIIEIAMAISSQVIPLLDAGLEIGSPRRFVFDVFENYLLGNLAAMLIPLSIAISILRYRLWDIDLILRRTAAYTLLSGMLGLVYLGSVVLLRQLFGGLAGNSSAALVLSTLLMAALFNPLRRRLQNLIDRRFSRQRYDAEQVLQEFSAAARDEVELPVLTRQLNQTINMAVQPQSLGIWLREKQP